MQLPKLLGDAGCILTSHSKYCNALEAGDTALRWRKNGNEMMAAKAVRDVTPAGESEVIPAIA